IGVAMEDSKGVVVEVNSETDFVARNDLFQGLVKMIANVALAVGPDVEKIKVAKVGDITLAEAIADTIAKIGENMSLRRASSLSVANGVIGSYVHNSVEQGLGKIGVLVALQSTGKGEELKRFGRMLAMHVAASNPQAIEASGLDPDLVRREREVLADKYRSQGKPPNVIDKIVESGLKTFYKEVCLVDQAYIHDPDKTVSQAMKDSEGKLGAPIKVTGFIRYAVGGGNIFRGVNVSEKGIPRVTGDLMGMLATVMNALALESAMEKVGLTARTMSALGMPQICESYERRRALRHIEQGRVVLLAGG